MKAHVAPHEKVRFRRRDFRALESLPSASGQPPRRRIRRRRNLWLRSSALLVALVAAVAMLLVATVYLAGSAGFGSERLRQEAETAISAFAGMPISVEAGPARLSLDGSRLIALEIPDVRLSKTGHDDFTSAGALRLGFSLWPLLGGRLEVTSVSLDDAEINAALVPSRGTGNWRDGISDERGLIDPDRVIDTVFSALDRALTAFGNRSTSTISLDNVAIVVGEGAAARRIVVDSAKASRTRDGGLGLQSRVLFGGRTLSISGDAARDGDAGLRFGIHAGLEEADVVAQNSAGGDSLVAPAASDAPPRGGAAKFAITGERPRDGGADRMQVTASGRDLVVPLPQGRTANADVGIAAVFSEGSGKIEINHLNIVSGRSTYAFHGAVGPSAEQDAPAYRWELVTDASTVATSDALEPALPFVARIAGNYLPETRLLNASEIGVRTQGGELAGTAALQFAEGMVPAIALAVDVPSMPVPHLKQLWPSIAAPGPRSWVLANVFGGTVRNSSLRFKVPAGRLGNGVPLTGEEINGHFEVEQTRFDMTGDLPPVRDASGVVDFRAADVDIALTSGTVYMPTGRTLAARDGSFLIRRVAGQPLIGSMDIHVEGDAPSAVEFASYKPIDAMRHLKLMPEDFSGSVSGNVKADIPLQKDFPPERLTWNVALDYTNLALAKPLEGQLVTEAVGSIHVDPRAAVIAASAKLNGMPAKIAMTEPLSPGAPGRIRDVSLVLDAAARDRIAPGLNTMLKGSVAVSVSVEPDGGQRMKADLTGATLTLPWVGWTKGPGIDAKAEFVLSQDGGTTRLSDFRLTGKSFGAEGEITVANGGLSEARFRKAALNRGDDIAVTIRASGKGYTIDVSGGAFDARPVIKLYVSNTDEAEKAVESVPITLSAKVARVVGFGEEGFSGVTVNLGGTGTDLGVLKIRASAASGADVDISNTTNAGGRSVSIRSADAGAVLRFLDIYEYMRGGTIDVALAAKGNGPLVGQVEARNFAVVNEPKLRSLVATAPADGDGRSLNQVVKRDIDVSRAEFERGFAVIEKGDRSLTIDRGVLRGPVIGATFQGTFYDPKDQMAMTGTFMPAYGLNRLFAEIPLFGQILGNGRDRGLIGITFKLSGNASSPQLQVNPISVIAPGIFRSIFEFD